jgi:hypothetical protein
MAVSIEVSLGATVGNTTVNGTKAYSADTRIQLDKVAINNGSTNKLVTLAGVDVSEMKALVILATQDMTLYTNDLGTGAPDDTLALKAGVPVIWTTDSLAVHPKPFTVDITSNIYLTNASGSDGTLSIEIIQDPTP